MKFLIIAGLASASLGLTSAAGGAERSATTPGLSATVSRPASTAAARPTVLAAAIAAARTGDLAAARRHRAELGDPVEMKLVDWALADAAHSRLSLNELEALGSELRGWPRGARRSAILAKRREARPAGPVPYAAVAPDRRLAKDYRARRLRMTQALRRGDVRAAYGALVGHRQRPGSVAFAELESFAGWLALNKLSDPAAAERHFARLDAAVRSPVSRARAAYWRGRAAEQAGDPIGAQLFYARGARFGTTFYGQLAAERAGHSELVLAPDPVPTGAERSAFANAEMTRAIQRLASAGERRLVRVFALHQAGRVRSGVELALLVDSLRRAGETEVALLAYRRGARLGHVLYERGYPVLTPPEVTGGAEAALVLAITRQESQFDPRVRSGADARGMMQILPSTGRQVARRVGLAWNDSLLWDATANMRLGSRYLGDLVDGFGGSYVLATAGYNAGPGRPRTWVDFCGDPRSSNVDPLDFIECIPFGETRDYVMNVMANYQVYQARLNGGRAPLEASDSLRAPGLSASASRPCCRVLDATEAQSETRRPRG